MFDDETVLSFAEKEINKSFVAIRDGMIDEETSTTESTSMAVNESGMQANARVFDGEM